MTVPPRGGGGRYQFFGVIEVQKGFYKKRVVETALQTRDLKSIFKNGPDRSFVVNYNEQR